MADGQTDGTSTQKLRGERPLSTLAIRLLAAMVRMVGAETHCPDPQKRDLPLLDRAFGSDAWEHSGPLETGQRGGGKQADTVSDTLPSRQEARGAGCQVRHGPPTNSTGKMLSLKTNKQNKTGSIN